MITLNPHPDPQPDRAIQLQLAEYGAAHRATAAAGPPATCAELDRYDIAVVLQAVYEWGGYRYSAASDAIAAAKRATR
jgi:hypothetical protein